MTARLCNDSFRKKRPPKCADEIRAARILSEDFPIGGITAYGSLAGDYWFAPAGRELVAPFFFQSNERLPQYLTEEVLRRKMGDMPNVTSLFGWTAGDVERHDDGIQVSVTNADQSKTVALKADYLVGCDGAHSAVRDRIGVGRDGSDFGQRMSQVDG